MNPSKTSLQLSISKPLFYIAFFAAVVFSQLLKSAPAHAAETATDTPAAAATTPAPISQERLDNSLTEVIEALKSIYYKEFSLNEDTETGAIRGLLSSLDERYTRYVPPGVLWDPEKDEMESYGGLGVLIDLTADGVMVFRVKEGSAAAEAGIAPGDIIVEAGGKALGQLSMQEISGILRGEIGSGLKLKIKKKDVEENADVELTRGLVQASNVESKIMPEGIGVLQIIQFGSTVSMQAESEINKLLSGGVRAIIVDLRNNPGGLVHTAAEVADLFLDDGMIALLEPRDDRKRTEFFAHKENTLVHVPVAVLVNGYTASAAEMLAAALKQLGGTPVLGEKTFGKALAQIAEPLSNGGMLWITEARVLAGGNLDINGVGLPPDVEIKDENNSGKDEKKEKTISLAEKEKLPDPVLDTAVEYVMKNILSK